MCGLVGVAGVLTTKDRDVFNQMLYGDFLRGNDSTGVGSVSQYSGEVKLIKAATDPIGLFNLKGYTDVVAVNSRVLMGHNRAATRGKVNKWNAHPFHVNSVLAAHNGTLEYGCLKDLEDGPEGDTDSEQLVATIDAGEGSTAENIRDAIAKASGAWALSVYGTGDNTINLVRNKERPLFYCMSESKKTLYWCSEVGLLHWILDRNNIKRGKIYEVSVDTILTWVIPKSNEIFNTATRTKAEGKERVNFQRTYGGHNGPWYGWTGDNDRHSSYQGSSSANRSGGSSDKSGGTNELWGAYGEGWSAGEKGESISKNPYTFTSEGERFKRNRWLDGFKEATRYVLDRKNRQDAAAKEAADNVVPLLLPDKRTDIYDTRDGPGGKKLTKVAFKEMTGCKCGWCDDPVDFTDKGRFISIAGMGNLYFCEACVNNKATLTEVTEMTQNA